MTNSVSTMVCGVRPRPVAPWIVRAVVLLAGVWLAPALSVAQSTGQPTDIFGDGSVTLNVTVPNGRGLADVLTQIQQLFLTPVTYEELPYENPTDLRTVTVVKDGGPVTVLVNPVTDFSVTLTASDSSAYLAVQSAMAAYRNAGHPGAYSVSLQGVRVDVRPSQILGANGSTRNVTPVMDQRVTLPAATRNVADTLQLATDALTRASGFKVILLGLPFSPLETVELGAISESARDLITDIGTAARRPLSFQCVYEPSTRTYYLNVVAVVAPPAPGVPPASGYVKAQPAIGPLTSPFFTKP